MTSESQQHHKDINALFAIFGIAMSLMVMALVILMVWCTSSHAHDATNHELDQWYENLMQPKPNERVPCCGESDAYFADGLHVRDGKTFVTITDDRDDAKLNRRHIPIGTEFEVPDEKLKWDNGNPTGHAVLFLNINGVVLCYVQGSGI